MARQRTKPAFLCCKPFSVQLFIYKIYVDETEFLDYLVAGSFVDCFFLQFDNHFAEA